MPDDSPMCYELRELAATIKGMNDSLTLLHELSLERSEKVNSLKKVVDEQGEAVKSLLDAWETGQGVAKFVRWAAPIAAGIGTFIGAIVAGWLWVRTHVHFIP